PPPPPPPATEGVSKTYDIGTGNTALKLYVSQDAVVGNALYAVYLDGKQVGSTLTGSALHGQGSDVVNLHADLSAGNHNLVVRYLSDSWGSTGDHNLYLDAVVDAGGRALAVTNSAMLDTGATARAMLHLDYDFH
ncbi:hypothetical protein J7U37_15945, partial [Methylobacterium sp. 37f]